MNAPTQEAPGSPLHAPGPHESGLRHATGEARYVDDLPEPRGLLVTTLVTSPHARARITSLDGAAALRVPGVVAVLTARDVPGRNAIGPAVHDEPLLAEDEVFFAGQVVAAVLAEGEEAGRAGAARVDVGYEPLPAVLDLEQAIAEERWLTRPHRIRRGDVDRALAEAAVRLEGTLRSGAQDHLYLETHAALAVLEEDDTVRVWSSTQHPTEVQREVAGVLGLRVHRVVCQVPRLGGGFGGKESQASPWACLAALGAWLTRRPVKVWLDRDTDMRVTGKRHPFLTRYEAGFDGDGRLTALRARLYADGGWSTDLTGPIVDRALFHCDSAYYLPHVDLVGVGVRTDKPSNTAFRGFGGPQGMLVVEEALNRYAERFGLDPAEVRRRSFYGGAPRNVTPYGQELRDVRLARIDAELRASSDYDERRAALAAFNAASPHARRGLGLQAVKFGISFTNAVLNQAGALVHVYTDGSVQLNHGGIEMGQGLHTKMRAIAAHELGVTLDAVRVMDTSTEKVPNTSATAASSGSDLNGQAVAQACGVLRERLRPLAAMALGVPQEEAGGLRFEGGRVTGGGRHVPFAEVAQAAWANRVPLSATGYYATPGVAYDAAQARGTPFYYYAYGAAVVEVEVSGLTGEHRVRRVDILHDAGDSLVPGIDRGQVEGGFVQGMGWLTMEEMLFDAEGRALTVGPSTYKIPACGDVPADLRVRLLDRAAQPGVIHGSKAVGEPPFMLALGVLTALRQAVAAFGPPGREVRLQPPCTPEAILRAVEAQRA